MRSPASRHRPGFWILLWGVTIAAELGALLPELVGSGPTPPAWEVAFRLVGGSFAACGLVAWRRRPENRSGPLMVATGLSFLAGPLLEQFDAPVMQTLVAAARRPLDRPARRAAAVVPERPAACGPRPTGRWSARSLSPTPSSASSGCCSSTTRATCSRSSPTPAPRTPIDTVAARARSSAPRSATFAVLARRWWVATPPLRRAMLPSLAGGVSLLLFAALLASDIVTGAAHPLPMLTWACVVGLVLTPAAFLAGLLRTRLARGGFADLVVELRGLRGGALQAALARTLRDPTLVLAGWLPEYEAYVDAGGQVVLPPAPGSDRRSTAIERDDRPIAMLVHDRSLDDEPEALEAVCAAAALALENEQLQTESRARLAELQASRARIVEAGDTERRRLERNLHDGAQQRLVAVALQLRLIRARARQRPVERQGARDQGGRRPRRRARRAARARPRHPPRRPRPRARRRARVARGALDGTDHADRRRRPAAAPADRARRLLRRLRGARQRREVRARHRGDAARRAQRDPVTVEIADNGVGGADASRGSGLRGLEDRVEALDGALRVSSPAGGGTTVSAELPCAS